MLALPALRPGRKGWCDHRAEEEAGGGGTEKGKHVLACMLCMADTAGHSTRSSRLEPRFTPQFSSWAAAPKPRSLIVTRATTDKVSRSL